MDTNLQLDNKGLEFFSLSDLTPLEIVKQMERSRILVELSKGFGIVAFADQFSQKELAWLSIVVAQA